MPRDKQRRKLAQYIEQGRLSRLRSYVRKHQVDVKLYHIGERKDTLVHLACRHGDNNIVRWLLKEGVTVEDGNSLGQLPLHTACLFALHQDKNAYTSLVLPVLQAWKMALDVPDNSGVTPRQLLGRIKADLQEKKYEEDTSSSDEEPEDEIEINDWEQRLAAEADEEFSELGNRYEQNYSDDEGETYDQWASRMYHEHKNKRYAYVYAHEERLRKEKQQEEEARKEFQRKCEREHEEYQKKAKERREARMKLKASLDKKLYEEKCIELFRSNNESGEYLTFNDIPWPHAKGADIGILKDFLFSDLDPRDTGRCRKYIREQQVQWHPDKFLQRVGPRLLPGDRDRVLDHVKEISQALNKLAAELEDS